MRQYKARGGQRESTLQLQLVQGLNLSGLGYFWRVRNGATFDPVKRVFRSNVAEKGLPDINGWKKEVGRTRPVFIEVKYIAKVEDRKILLFAVDISREQKDFLARAFTDGCIAGVAFNFDDALAIAHDDPYRYPRHPRTYCFLPKPLQESYAESYIIRKKALAEERRDPLARDIHHALPSKKD